MSSTAASRPKSAGVLQTATRWRVLSLDTGGQGMAEIEMMSEFGQPSQTVGGTASASGIFSGSFPASNCFDDNIFTEWAGSGTASGQWVEYTFASPVTVTSVAITSRGSSNGNQAPNQGAVQYFDGVDWVEYIDIDNNATWGARERRVFTHPDFLVSSEPGQAHTYWRVLFQTVTSEAASAAEIEFRPTFGGVRLNPDTPLASDAPFGSSFAPAQAFDANAATAWASALGTNAWIGGRFNTATKVEQLSVQARSGFGNQCFRTGKVQYSDNGKDWFDEKNLPAQTLWASNETRTFDLR